MKRNHLSLAIGLTLSLAAVQVHAQDAAPTAGSDEAVTLDAVQVTARKREETLQEVPVAVTAFTAETLDKLNIRDISDLDAQVPNLTIYAARGSSSTVTGQPVSDKEILAMRGQLGAYVTDDFNVQFAFDWLEDQSGVRGAKMLSPNRFTPLFQPLDDRYDVRNGMPNVNDTTSSSNGSAERGTATAWARML